MAPMEKQMLYRARHAVSGEWFDSTRNAPDLEAGDLAYFDPDRPHDVQIRPLLANERPEGAIGTYPPGAMWVAWKSRTGKQIRAIVALPAPYRKNIASNVWKAIRKVHSYSPVHAALLTFAMQGVDVFDDKFAVISEDE